MISIYRLNYTYEHKPNLQLITFVGIRLYAYLQETLELVQAAEESFTILDKHETNAVV